MSATVDVTLRVFVFVREDDVVAVPGGFDQWCAFGRSELEAALAVQTRYRLGGVRLKLVQTLEDRRRPQDRREADRRADA